MINNGKLEVINTKSIIIMIHRALIRKSIIVKHNMRIIMGVEVLIITTIRTATIKSTRLNMLRRQKRTNLIHVIIKGQISSLQITMYNSINLNSNLSSFKTLITTHH